MCQPRIEILGVYKVEVTEELFRKSLLQKYGGPDGSYLESLSNKQREAAEKHVRAELDSIVLIEIFVENADAKFDVSDFHQKRSNQVAYDEAFITPDGTSIVSRCKMPEGDKFRMTFFLHQFNPRKKLQTSYGKVSLPKPQRMSERLLSLIPYEPVD